MESIVHQKDGSCFLCEYIHQDYRIHTYLEKHHIFGGPNRKHSERTGLFCWLCPEHHRTGKEAVHLNKDIRIQLQAHAQRVYEQTHSREEFMRIFGRSYI